MRSHHVSTWAGVALLLALVAQVKGTATYDPSNATALADNQVLNDPFPYYFPELGASPADLFAFPPCNGITIEDASIDELQGYLQSGKLTSVDLVTCYVQRSYQTGEYINSVLQLNPDALSIAATLDEERSKGQCRSPLHGIPFLVKDNIASKDRLGTTAGSWALEGSIVPRDAFVVRKLREAGAILMGKATLSEWAVRNLSSLPFPCVLGH
jgi:amidase